MGLFSSSKPPQPPLPKFSIFLDSAQDKVFKPDDLVTGYIAITPEQSITPVAIEVTLFGQSQIWHRTSHNDSNNRTQYRHWRDNAPLFGVTENVLPAQGAALEWPETHRFPFSIRFPAGTGSSRRGQYKFDDDPRYHIGPHDLPPTFLQGDGENPNYAKIEYGIQARLQCPGVYVVQGKNMVDLMAVAPILFQPLNRHENELIYRPLPMQQNREPFLLQSSTLAEGASSNVGFRQSMRDRFSSSTPKLSFESTLEFPNLLASGSEFRFRAAFTVLEKVNGASWIPPITLTVLRLEMLDFTFIRAPCDWEASDARDGHHRHNRHIFMPAPDTPFTRSSERDDFTERKTTLNSIPPFATLELVEVPNYEDKKEMIQADNCETWFTARIPGYTTPSFKSFAITRAYKIRVRMGIEIGGKKFQHDMETDVCTLESAVTTASSRMHGM